MRVSVNEEVSQKVSMWMYARVCAFVCKWWVSDCTQESQGQVIQALLAREPLLLPEPLPGHGSGLETVPS